MVDESEFEDFPRGTSLLQIWTREESSRKFGVCHQVMLLCDNVLEQYPIAGLTSMAW